LSLKQKLLLTNTPAFQAHGVGETLPKLKYGAPIERKPSTIPQPFNLAPSAPKPLPPPPPEVPVLYSVVDPDPHQIKSRIQIRIRIRIKVICWIRIRISLQMTSRNVGNMSLFEHFFKGLRLAPFI
jgi:hypothetical protein